MLIILWFSGRGKSRSGDMIDYQSKTYSQGYWDGYRARQREEITSKADINVVSDNSNQQLIESPPGLEDAVVTIPPQPEISESELKSKRDLQNINTALYVASFLLVAAAAMFVGTALPEGVRFIGVWFITVLFYVAGLFLHKNYKKLRPAAVAFVGTGLAILPFTGIAMYNFVLPEASICWFITSLIGLIAFVFAAVRLKSQVVSYFAIAFMISAVTSSVATVGAGLVWYFVVLIVFGSLMTFISMIKPSWVPGYFAKPIQKTDQWIVPLTLIASIFTGSALSLNDYWVITIVSTIYYIAVAMTTSRLIRDIAILFARILASISVLLIAFDVAKSWMVVSIVFAAVGVLQVIVSSIYLPKRHLGKGNNEICLWIGFAMQVFAPIFLAGYEYWDIVLFFQLVVMAITSYGLSYFLRRSEISSFGLLSLAILPILVGLRIFNPALEPQWIALVFLALSSATITIRSIPRLINAHPSIRVISNISYAVFTFEALLFTFNLSPIWGFVIWVISAIMTYNLVYLERNPGLGIVANFMSFISIVWFVQLIEIASNWRLQAISWLSLMIFYGIYLALVKISKKLYAVYFWWSAIVIAGFINLVSMFDFYTPELSTVLLTSVIGLTLVSMAVIVKAWKAGRYEFVDLGVVLATIGFQRLLAVNVPDTNILVYTHWWAITIAGLGYLYFNLDKREAAKMHMIAALSFMSFFTGILALTSSMDPTKVVYQNLFLAEHILTLIAGLVLSRKLFTIWGAVGVALAVLWMLAGYTYLLLALVAFVIIGIAVASLHKQSQDIK